MSNKYKILVIEDEPKIRSFMSTILEMHGYKVVTAGTCNQGILMFCSHCPDLIILDLGLPDMDGLEFIKKARETSAVPIIVLSARTAEEDKVSALDLGANDYITKPFGTAELLARVRVALRNNRHRVERGAPSDGVFVSGDLKIDYDRRKVYIAEREIKLTQTEYNILVLFSEHAGKVLTYAFIIRTVWGATDSGSVKKLQVNMANIRKKLGLKPGDNKYFSNELGVGYRMNDINE